MSSGGELGHEPAAWSGQPVKRAFLLAAGTFAVWLGMWAITQLLDIAVMDESQAQLVQVLCGVVAGVLAVPLTLLAHRRPGLSADLIVVSAAGAAAGLATIGLHGTRWGMDALRGDSSFRTEMAMRYADSPALADYAYADLFAYYPPAIGWLTGRLADVTGLAGWEAVKPMQILLAAVVPLLSYALWRRVLPVLPAACVVAALTALRGDLQKPDEWLVMACGVPWWLNAFRGVRREGTRPWPAWTHGVVAGLLLLAHTFDFLPLAIATVLGMAIDVVRRRPFPLSLRQLVVLVVVGLAVATPTWIGVAIEVGQGIPPDDLQRRYYYEGAGVPWTPGTDTFLGLLGLLGLGWLLFSLWPRVKRTRLPGALAGLLAAGYLTVLGGDVAARNGVPLLTFKADALVMSLYVVLGVLSAFALTGWVSQWLVRRWRAAGGVLAAGAMALAVSVPVTLYAVERYATGWGVLLAQTTRYPSGAAPAGQHGVEPPVLPAFSDEGDPSAAETLDAWHRLFGRTEDSDTVLVTSRVELLATSTLHPYLTWKSIYSSPVGQWRQRYDVLQQVAACPDSTCAADLLRNNPYDAVHGLILEREPDSDELALPLLVDDFPDLHDYATVYFSERLFTGPEFRTRDVGRLVVIALT